MPTFTFHCDRGHPGTSCVPMLSALGAAALGFEVLYERSDPSGSPASRMMPDCLRGVDVRGSSASQAASPANGPPDRECVTETSGRRTIRILDAPLPDPSRPYDRNTAGARCLVTRAALLPRYRDERVSLRLVYGGIGRNRPHRIWDAEAGGYRLDLPILTEVEIASLLHGAPMPGPRHLADELARAILGVTCTLPSGPITNWREITRNRRRTLHATGS